MVVVAQIVIASVMVAVHVSLLSCSEVSGSDDPDHGIVPGQVHGHDHVLDHVS
jgi:hypothetical protein